MENLGTKKLESRGANLANQKGGKMIEFIATVCNISVIKGHIRQQLSLWICGSLEGNEKRDFVISFSL